MNESREEAKDNRSNHRSSMNVSGNAVCADEACIGKVDGLPDAPSDETAKPDARGNDPSKSSISVGGRRVCDDDACIGKP